MDHHDGLCPSRDDNEGVLRRPGERSAAIHVFKESKSPGAPTISYKGLPHHG